jgi:hypothetical protein
MANAGVTEALEKIQAMPKKQKRAIRKRIKQSMKPGSRLGQQRLIAAQSEGTTESMIKNMKKQAASDKAAKKRGFVSDG